MKFVVSHLDQQLGPFDEQELKMKWAAGEILPIDYVFDEEKQDWILLADRFLWAAKPVKDDGSAPPPIREVNILKRPTPATNGGNGSNGISAAIGNKEITLTGVTIPNFATETITTAKPAPAVTGATPTPTPSAPAPAPVIQANVDTVTMTGTSPVMESLKEAMNAIRYTEIVPRKPEPTPAPVKPEVRNAAAAVTKPAPATTPAMKATPVMTDTKVTLVNGVAEINFTPTSPGQVELNVKDTNGAEIRSVEPLQINVKPLEPAEVRWEFTSTQTVGQEVHIKIWALDDRGHGCDHYNDQYLVQVRGPVSQDLAVEMLGGQASITLNHTKAERWTVSLHYSGTKHVRLPEASELDWRPGPAVKLVLDGPQEYLAGDNMKVRVKAVDAYGNTADTYQGTVALEVRAS